MNNSTNSNLSGGREEQEINIKQLFEQYSYYWKWFILSIIVCVIAAFFYLRYASKIYNVSAKILLQDESKAAGELAGLSELTSLGGIGSPTSAFVSDQIDVMKSRRIFLKVVTQNKLNISYYSKGNVKSSEMLEEQSPIRLVLLEPNNLKLDSIQYKLIVRRNGNNYGLEDEVYGRRNYVLGQRIQSPIGPIMILPQGKREMDSDIIVSVIPNNQAVDDLLNSVNIVPNKEKQSYVVGLSMNSKSVSKAE